MQRKKRLSDAADDRPPSSMSTTQGRESERGPPSNRRRQANTHPGPSAKFATKTCHRIRRNTPTTQVTARILHELCRNPAMWTSNIDYAEPA
jgi:hypothetical protein